MNKPIEGINYVGAIPERINNPEIASEVRKIADSANKLINVGDFKERFLLLKQQPILQGLDYDEYCDQFLLIAEEIKNKHLFDSAELVLALSKIGNDLIPEEKKKQKKKK